MGYRLHTITQEREYGYALSGWEEWRELVTGVDFISFCDDESYYEAYEDDVKEYIKKNPEGTLTNILKESLKQKPADSSYVSWEFF